MANTTAFGVANVGDQGTSPLAMRRSIEVLFDAPGVVSGLAVSPAAGGYAVAAGLAVTKRGPSDGMALAWHDGGTAAPAHPSNPSSNPRLDVVWLVSHDPQYGDGDNLVALGVTEGSAAANPAVPSVPSYATVLAVMRVPAGATTLSSATRQSAGPAAIVRGATMGILGHKVNTSNAQGTAAWSTVCSCTFTLPVGRAVRIDTVTSMRGAVKNVGTACDGSMHLRLLVDDRQEIRWERQLRSAVTCEALPYTKVLGAGTHTVALQGSDGTSGWTPCYSHSNGTKWPGQVLTVVDEGSAT
ncbi:hypothetical protein AAK967_00195 [Atopobiaceae bacterium 24-176]